MPNLGREKGETVVITHPVRAGGDARGVAPGGHGRPGGKAGAGVVSGGRAVGGPLLRGTVASPAWRGAAVHGIRRE
jgi:hypothetical protein